VQGIRDAIIAAFLINTGIAVSCAAQISTLPPTLQSSIVTYRYDGMRTGWNSTEYILNVDSVKRLKLKDRVVLLDEPDDQVDAQPLYKLTRSLSICLT
jgi:hypothetical protein